MEEEARRGSKRTGEGSSYHIVYRHIHLERHLYSTWEKKSEGRRSRERTWRWQKHTPSPDDDRGWMPFIYLPSARWPGISCGR